MYSKKGGGSTSSTCSTDSVNASESTSKQSNSVRVHAPPQREPLKQTENVMKSQASAVRTENSITKVRNRSVININRNPWFSITEYL
jgi:hypothetical protein